MEHGRDMGVDGSLNPRRDKEFVERVVHSWVQMPVGTQVQIHVVRVEDLMDMPIEDIACRTHTRCEQVEVEDDREAELEGGRQFGVVDNVEEPELVEEQIEVVVVLDTEMSGRQ